MESEVLLTLSKKPAGDRYPMPNNFSSHNRSLLSFIFILQYP